MIKHGHLSFSHSFDKFHKFAYVQRNIHFKLNFPNFNIIFDCNQDWKLETRSGFFIRVEIYSPDCNVNL